MRPPSVLAIVRIRDATMPTAAPPLPHASTDIPLTHLSRPSPTAEAPLSPQWLGGFQKGPNANGAKAAADKVRPPPLDPARDPIIDPLARLLPSPASRSPSDPAQIRRSDEARSFVFRPSTRRLLFRAAVVPPRPVVSRPSTLTRADFLALSARIFPRADRHALRARGRRHRGPLER